MNVIQETTRLHMPLSSGQTPILRRKVSKEPSLAVQIAEWERRWQELWGARGAPTYELPPCGHKERDFLTHTRTPKKERARLQRIHDEFVEGFRALYKLGPAVTVELILWRR